MSYLEEQLNIKECEPHYKAAMYVKEHGLSLLDFDCWTHLEDLLGFEISYDDYCKADSTIEGDLLEVEHGDETHHAILRALNGEQPQRTTIYTVAIKDLECNEADIWTSAFSTREAAENFKVPHGCMSQAAKLAELRECMANGATEVDVALNVLAIKSGRLDVAQRELDELVRCAVGKVQLKAVFEHALYTPEEKRAVLQMLRSSGVNYVKIQNMLSGHGARVEDVRFASEILGRNVGIKIDGGIKTLAQAEELLAAGATRLGLTATAKIAEEALKNA